MTVAYTLVDTTSLDNRNISGMHGDLLVVLCEDDVGTDLHEIASNICTGEKDKLFIVKPRIKIT